MQIPRQLDGNGALRGALTGTAITFLLMYVALGLLRVSWPIPLDDLELAVIGHVRRVVAGLPVYAAPTVDFVPLAYTPLFYHVAAWIWTPLGGGFVAVRFVSFAASVMSLGLVALIVYRETGSRRAALLAAGLRAAVGGELGWLVLARVDALMLLLTLAGLYSLRFARSWVGVAAAGTFFGLAVLTKQPAVFIFAAMAVWQLLADRRRSVALVCGFAGTVTVIGALWEWQSGGWFTYFAFRVGANQWSGDVVGTLHDTNSVLRVLPFGVLAACLLPLKAVRESLSVDRDSVRFWMFATLGALIACVATKVVHGTDRNALLPICSYLVIQLAIGVHALVRLARRVRIPAIESAATVLLLAQFLAVSYLPARLLPGAEALIGTGKWVVRVTHDQDPRRWLYWSPFDPSTHADSQAVTDLLGGGTPSVRDAFLRTLRQAYCQPPAGHPVDVDQNLLPPHALIFAAPPAPCGLTEDIANDQ